MNIARLFVASALSTPCVAATITVDPAGSVTTIQAGIDLASPGDKVRVKAGTYFENPRIPAGKDGMKLQGDGTVVLDAFPPGGPAAGAAIVVESANVKIENLRIRNARRLSADAEANKAHGILVLANGFGAKSLEIESCLESGIFVLSADNATIADCEVSGSIIGIVFEGGTDYALTDSLIRDSDGSAIELRNADTIAIDDCRVERVRNQNAVRARVGVTTNLDITDSRFESTGSFALDLDVGDSTIERCDFASCLGALNLTSSFSVAFRNNAILDAFDRDLVILNNSTLCGIEGNSLRGGGRSGIRLVNSSFCVVRDNSIREIRGALDAGILAESGGGNHVIEGNSIKDVAGDGIRIETGNATLIANKVKRALRDGFDLDASGAHLENNSAKDCAGEGLDLAGTGAIVRDNVFKKNRIDVAATVAFATFDGNTFTTGGAGTLPEID